MFWPDSMSQWKRDKREQNQTFKDENASGTVWVMRFEKKNPIFVTWWSLLGFVVLGFLLGLFFIFRSVQVWFLGDKKWLTKSWFLLPAPSFSPSSGDLWQLPFKICSVWKLYIDYLLEVFNNRSHKKQAFEKYSLYICSYTNKNNVCCWLRTFVSVAN